VLNLRQIMAVFQEEEEVVVVEKVVEEVDYNCNSLSAELELKKLQSLVRSLERQNQQLRSRRDATSSTSNFQYKNIKNNNNNNNARPSGVLECSPDEEEPIALLDGVEELDLDGLFPGDSDEETWWVSARRSHVLLIRLAARETDSTDPVCRGGARDAGPREKKLYRGPPPRPSGEKVTLFYKKLILT